jgi:hypothetical protein
MNVDALEGLISHVKQQRLVVDVSAITYAYRALLTKGRLPALLRFVPVILTSSSPDFLFSRVGCPFGKCFALLSMLY